MKRILIPVLVGVMFTLCSFSLFASGPYPTHVVIYGPTAVQENSSTPYSAILHLDDGSTSDVSMLLHLSAPSSYADYSSGHLVATSVPSDQTVTFAVSATQAGVTVTNTKTVTIMNIDKEATSIVISGPGDVPEGCQAYYSVTLYFDDGSSQPVYTPAWTVSGPAAMNKFTTLTAGFVRSDTYVYLTVTHTYNNKTVTGTHSVLVTNEGP